MSGLSQRAMRCRPWSGHWNPVAGLLSIQQFTAMQLLRSGHRWSEWAGSFLDVVHNQTKPLTPTQECYLARLVAEYGRTVAPVTVGGEDAGFRQVRLGDALAAPQYLGADPARAKLYNEGERLARLNGLGMHDTFMPQTPSQYRHDGAMMPDRETVARFWDSPTPLQGLPADKEATLRQLYATGTADEINGFLSANGYQTSRPEDLAAFIRKRDKGAKADTAVSYTSAPPLMIDAGDGVGGAVVRKGASGFLAGGLDELGAVVDTLGGTGGRESVWNSDRRLADIWANNQRQNAAILSYDQTAHPVASTTAEIGGGLLGGFAIPYGQGARTAAELAKVGAVYGGATGFLSTDGDVADRSLGAVKGTLAGALATPVLGKGLEAAPKLIEAARALRSKLPVRGAPAAPVGVRASEAPIRAPDAPAGNSGDEWGAFPVVADDAAPSTMPMEAAPVDSLSMAAPRSRDYLDLNPARPRPMDDDYTTAERLAAADRVGPRDVLPAPGNTVANADELAAIDAGRFGPAKAPNELDQLDRLTVPGLNGPVPKRGPVDMVGWLRAAGGLAPDGELAHMGVTNAPRRGLDLVGQEARFGPLVHDQGMNLDDAALQAWEAGYFPELNDRPSINEFLDALRDTYEGTARRRFRAEDQAQVEAFDLARQERYRFEQHSHDAGGKLYADRSVDAGPHAPFAPPEAYDDASREAIKRVGNLDVSKLDSPQDIARALKVSEGALSGFDAATRGRIAHTETERLAADLGMTADKLLARRKGEAFNAEEALAARQILAKSGNELVNAAKAISKRDDPGEELLSEFRRKWVRHVAIQEQVSGMTAEAGRALQQFRQMADSRAVRTDVLNAMAIGGGGKDRLRDAATALVDMVEREPGNFHALADKLAKPKWRDKITELYINFLLSNPATHAVNVVSNTLTSIAQIPEYAAGAAIGGVRRLAVGENASDRILASEVGARAFGLLQGAKEGARMFAHGPQFIADQIERNRLAGEQGGVDLWEAVERRLERLSVPAANT